MTKFISAIGALIATSVNAAPVTEWAWRCDFTEVTTCSGSTCAPSKPANGLAVWVYLYPTDGDYNRCEGNDFDKCDRFTARVSDSGSYKIFELPGRAAFIKVSDDLAALEVVSVMDTVLIRRGRCHSAPPPMKRTIEQ